MKMLVFVVVSVCVVTSYADDPKIGEMWRVSTETLTLREKPDGLSPAVASLKYNDAGEVVTTCRFAVPFNGDKDKFPDTLLPLWVKVKVDGKTGYLPFPMRKSPPSSRRADSPSPIYAS